MENRLLLQVVVRPCLSVIQLFARKDETPVVGKYARLVPNLRLYSVDRATHLHVKRDRFVSVSQVAGRFCLKVVLLTHKDETLLVWRDVFLSWNLAFSLSIVSLSSVSSMTILPLRVLLKTCIPLLSRYTRWRADSFWMLY